MWQCFYNDMSTSQNKLAMTMRMFPLTRYYSIPKSATDYDAIVIGYLLLMYSQCCPMQANSLLVATFLLCDESKTLQ